MPQFYFYSLSIETSFCQVLKKKTQKQRKKQKKLVLFSFLVRSRLLEGVKTDQVMRKTKYFSFTWKGHLHSLQAPIKVKRHALAFLRDVMTPCTGEDSIFTSPQVQLNCPYQWDLQHYICECLPGENK